MTFLDQFTGLEKAKLIPPIYKMSNISLTLVAWNYNRDPRNRAIAFYLAPFHSMRWRALTLHISGIS